MSINKIQYRNIFMWLAIGNVFSSLIDKFTIILRWKNVLLNNIPIIVWCAMFIKLIDISIGISKYCYTSTPDIIN